MVGIVLIDQKCMFVKKGPTDHKKSTYGIGIDASVAKPSERSPESVGGDVKPAGRVAVAVLTA